MNVRASMNPQQTQGRGPMELANAIN